MVSNNKEMTIGLYFIRDANGKGRITSFMEYPNDLYAVTAFKKFLESEEAKQFPVIGKLELKRLCLVGQVSDIAYLQSINITLCNAKNVDHIIKILTEKAESEE